MGAKRMPLRQAFPPAHVGRTLDSAAEQATAQEEPVMADHPNAAIIRAAGERMQASGDMMSMADMLDDDVVWHEIGRDEPIRGKQALMERWSGMPADASITADTHDVLANDDHCIQLVTATARMGDRELVYSTAEIYHMRDGRITERWAFSDDTDRINRFFGGV
jgi:ketosteroid isomerase-like protein